MCIDVKMAAAKLDLNRNHVLTTHANYYGICSGDKNDTIRRIEVEISGRKVSEEDFCVGFLKRHDAMAGINEFKIPMQSGYSFQNDNFRYNSKHEEMCAFWVDNPSIPGVLGVRVKLNPKGRYFFTSGRLSGCGVAMLMKEEYVYFIHAGASDRYIGGNNDEPYKVRELINRDIFRMLSFLDGNPYDLEQEISQRILRDLLYTRKYRGVIFGSTDQENLKQADHSGIAVLGYDVKKGFHNMIGVANGDGMSVGVRLRRITGEQNKDAVDNAEEYRFIHG